MTETPSDSILDVYNKMALCRQMEFEHGNLAICGMDIRMDRMLRSLVALSLVLTAGLAAAAASAPTPPGQAQAEGHRSSNKYALGADPGTADWTQGSQLPQGTGVQSASGDAFQNYTAPSPAGRSQPSGQPVIGEGAARVEDIAPASPNFVTTAGVHFTLDGSIRYFPGSNDYFLILR